MNREPFGMGKPGLIGTATLTRSRGNRQMESSIASFDAYDMPNNKCARPLMILR
jgi:hypothetical protein